ncbi:MAG TPA: hypothetical protein VFB01_11315 [Burkholderiales bacterium]|nr:hypothetical protein [Burkholderiales bacterium]
MKNIATFVLVSLAALAAGPASAHESDKLERAAQKTGAALERAAHKTGHALKKAAVKTGQALEKAGRKTAKWIDEKTS